MLSALQNADRKCDHFSDLVKKFWLRGQFGLAPKTFRLFEKGINLSRIVAIGEAKSVKQERKPLLHAVRAECQKHSPFPSRISPTTDCVSRKGRGSRFPSPEGKVQSEYFTGRAA